MCPIHLIQLSDNEVARSPPQPVSNFSFHPFKEETSWWFFYIVLPYGTKYIYTLSHVVKWFQSLLMSPTFPSPRLNSNNSLKKNVSWLQLILAQSTFLRQATAREMQRDTPLSLCIPLVQKCSEPRQATRIQFQWIPVTTKDVVGFAMQGGADWVS